MYKLIIFLFLSNFQVFATQSQASKQDFAYLADIQAGKESLRQFELPYEILSRLGRKDYGDMRIFNAQNQSIPFTLTTVQPKTQYHRESYVLPFFKLSDFPNWHKKLTIDITPSHSQFHFKASTTNWQENYLIIQNPYPSQGLQELQIHWETPLTGFSIKAKLEQSDDMQRWDSVLNNVTFYDLKRFDTVLVKNSIKLPRRNHAKYLRLSFRPKTPFALTISQIIGHYQHQTPPQYENWKSFELQTGELRGEWLFDTQSFISVAKMQFEIPQQGLLYKGRLFSKAQITPKELTPININNPHAFKKQLKKVLRHPHPPSQATVWRYHTGFTQYRLQTAAGEIESHPVNVRANRDRYWRILLTQPIDLLPEQLPKIKLAWHPVIVTFLAQGNEPYQLFFGNPNIKPPNTNLTFPAEIEKPETVSVINLRDSVYIQQLSTDKQSNTEALKDIQWQKILLWFLLLAGVLIMALMAYKLYQGINSTQTNDFK